VQHIVNNIFSSTPESFDQLTIEVFHYQYDNNQIYKAWVDMLGVDPASVREIVSIPFMPVSFFKSYEITTGAFKPDVIFESSGTTGTINSRHFVKDVTWYKQSFMKGFEAFYGDIKEWCVIGLLPAYLERQGSSLVFMVDEWIKMSGHASSGFYLYEFEQLYHLLQSLERQKQRTLLIGVTFALLDFAEKFPMHLQYTTVMETGGMKGRRQELIRNEVHDILTNQLQVSKVHSEYGMTELLSQAYSSGDGIFKTVPWMRILVRDEDDPLVLRSEGRGVINVIDLANIHSCSFIATDDVGTIYEDGSFEVIGRMDNSDIRGCSLMAV
jgi:phenylacetate-coenzyme A ligase PaaK-like adenylate-forming protein